LEDPHIVVVPADDVQAKALASKITEDKTLATIFVTSTFGAGGFPDMMEGTALSVLRAIVLFGFGFFLFVFDKVYSQSFGLPSLEDFWNYLEEVSEEMSSIDQITCFSESSMRYAVFGLGSSMYCGGEDEHFNRAAKRLDSKFQELGCEQIIPVGLGDDLDTKLYYTALEPWMEQLLPNLFGQKKSETLAKSEDPKSNPTYLSSSNAKQLVTVSDRIQLSPIRRRHGRFGSSSVDPSESCTQSDTTESTTTSPFVRKTSNCRSSAVQEKYKNHRKHCRNPSCNCRLQQQNHHAHHGGLFVGHWWSFWQMHD